MKHAQGPETNPSIALAIDLCEREIKKLDKLSTDSAEAMTPAVAETLPQLTRCLMALLKHNQQGQDDEALLEALLQDGKLADMLDKIKPPAPAPTPKKVKR